MEKEMRDKELFKSVLQFEQNMVDMRYRNSMHRMIQSDRFTKKMDHWSSKGYSSTALEKTDAELLGKLDSVLSRVRENHLSGRKKTNHSTIY
jgi:hypothetical protein